MSQGCKCYLTNAHPCKCACHLVKNTEADSQLTGEKKYKSSPKIRLIQNLDNIFLACVVGIILFILIYTAIREFFPGVLSFFQGFF